MNGLRHHINFTEGAWLHLGLYNKQYRQQKVHSARAQRRIVSAAVDNFCWVILVSARVTGTQNVHAVMQRGGGGGGRTISWQSQQVGQWGPAEEAISVTSLYCLPIPANRDNTARSPLSWLKCGMGFVAWAISVRVCVCVCEGCVRLWAVHSELERNSACGPWLMAIHKAEKVSWYQTEPVWKKWKLYLSWCQNISRFDISPP